MLSRLYIMAVLLLLPLDSVICSDYMETVANAFGRCSVSRILEQLKNKEEGSNLITHLSTSSNKFKKIVRIDECDRTITRWKENKVNTTVSDRSCYIRTCIKCLDLAIAAVDDLYKEARKDFKKLNSSVTRMMGRPSKNVTSHTPKTCDEVNTETCWGKKVPPIHL